MTMRLCQIFLKYTTFNCQISPARTLMLSYKMIGENPTKLGDPPVIVFHSFLSTKKEWEGFAKTVNMMTKRVLVVVDLRNHGDSPHESTHRYHELASDIIDLYNKLGITEASLVGHGMGGRASMAVALTHPKKVVSLLVVDMSPVSTPRTFYETMEKILNAMNKFKFTGLKKDKAEQMFKDIINKITKDDDVVQKVMQNISVKNSTLNWACNVETLIKDFEYIVSFPETFNGKKYEGPTLFIGGQVSDFIPADDLPAIRELFSAVVVKYIPKAGHNLHNHDVKKFLEIVVPFLKEYR